MPKILSENAKGLSDADQMVMALFSESDNNGSPSSSRQYAGSPLKTPNDRIAESIADDGKSGLLDKFRFGRWF